MRRIIRALIIAGIVGVATGLLMVLDPLLPTLNVTAPAWVWTVLTPAVIIFRFLVLFGPLALLSGGVAGYRVAKHSHERRLGILTSGLTGLSLLVANIVFFGMLFFLLLQHAGLRQRLDVGANRFLVALGLGPAGVDQSPSLSPAVLMIVGIVVCGFGLFNLWLALVSGVFGSWLALRHRTPTA